MLDTDSVSYYLRGQGKLAENVVRHQLSEICISAISLAQLCYGADRRASSALQASIDQFVGTIEIVPLTRIARDTTVRSRAISSEEELQSANSTC